ncbi:MAG: TRIC cation channel family protein [Candidatus Levybacteria bacterium]|nr:TRIC cation channel family protein [Candidatus Levybacteria bacterium]MDZ4227634.1 TRIC cation channel family protein [Candidatus Levybacteria bacterium]
MLYFLDLLGTLAFAITGAYKAKGAHLNIFGVIFLGIITSIGGGTFRDLIIGRTPLFYLKDSNYLLTAVLGGIIVYFVPVFFKKAYSLFRFVDSLGLAAFVVIGTSISFTFLFNTPDPSFISLLVSIFLGMVTGFGGGIIRDAIMGGVPLSLKHGSNYATSAFWGAFSFYFLMFVNIELATITSMMIVLFLREFVSGYGLYKKSVKKHTKSK